MKVNVRKIGNEGGNRKLLPTIVTALCVFSLVYQIKTLKLFSSKFTSGENGTASPSSTALAVRAHHRTEKYIDEAEAIIQRSYLNSYAHILPCDSSTIETNCLSKTTNYFNPSNETERLALPSVPWWFQTLLRDTVTNGAYGHWHHFSTTDPEVKFCSIEKVGTTEWRGVFCDLNEDECPNDNGNYPPHCISALPGRRCALRTNKVMATNAPSAVFVRDPLERLLSGFLDKCANPYLRTAERHCEPNEVFNPGANGWEATQYFEKNPKHFFAAYLDIMPLKWNLHFVPQALYCDLYRTIKTEYTFVGNMGKEFMFDLERMANQYGGRLPSQLDKTFGFVKAVEENRLNNTGKLNDRSHATHAPTKVAQYYTASTVRKALEYFSIDYVILGLEVPEWAKEMLRNETP